MGRGTSPRQQPPRAARAPLLAGEALLVGPALLHEDVHLRRAVRGALHALPLLDEAHDLGAFHFLGQHQVGNALTFLELATSLEEAGQSRARGDALDPDTNLPRTATVSNPRTPQHPVPLVEASPPCRPRRRHRRSPG